MRCQRLTELKTFEEFINEGINVQKIGSDFVVSFNDTHNKGIDMRLDVNPTAYKIGNVNVISVFKRTKHNEGNFDGNPLIYALKGEPGYKFDKGVKLNDMWDRFVEILSKEQPTFKLKNQYDVIVVVPSTNKLNQDIAEYVSKTIGCTDFIEGIFQKPHTEDVEILMDDKGFENECKRNNENAFDVKEKMDAIFSSKALSGDFFRVSAVLPKYRKYLKFYNFRDAIWNKDTQANKKLLLHLYDRIADKNILIIEDTVSTGITIETHVEILEETFNPKSVTVITLLSPRN